MKVIVWVFSVIVKTSRRSVDSSTPQIIFVESVCRVRTLSLTGRLARHLADHCLVLWPQLARSHSNTQYIGKFL